MVELKRVRKCIFLSFENGSDKQFKILGLPSKKLSPVLLVSWFLKYQFKWFESWLNLMIYMRGTIKWVLVCNCPIYLLHKRNLNS